MTVPIKTYNLPYALDVDQVCRCWTQDDDATQRPMGNEASALIMLAERFNQLASRHPVTVFSKVETPGTVFTNSLNPWADWKYDDRQDNAKQYEVRIVSQPRLNATWGGVANAYAARGGTTHAETTIWRESAANAVNSYYDATLDGYLSEPRTNPVGLTTDNIVTCNGYSIRSAVVQVREQAELLPGYHLVANPYQAKPEGHVLADILEEIRAKFHRLRTTNLPRVAGWSAHGDSDCINVTTNVDRVNLWMYEAIDRNAVTPGPTFECWRCGVGSESISQGQIVPIVARVCANWEAPQDYAINVNLEGPTMDARADNQVNISIAANAPAAWYSATALLWGNPLANSDWTNVGRNKIDILAMRPANTDGDKLTGTLHVYGFQLEYADPTWALNT